ncbi:DnaJ domain-containing protein [Mycena alexandri]|uniref:DnaJ domain-containing protein n=1 Tax=Mycena alexandri TaxID=1745969 RepID=A0AAD6SY67_9AGAR|nr:DnaJ domain-containing protein [Mycena alexandri]
MDSNPNTTEPPSLYEILGVDKSSTAEEIKRAYRQKALETHPDKLDPNASQEDKEASEAKFREAHEAFEVLRDAYKRRTYDIQRGFRPQNSRRWTDGEISEEQRRRMEDRHEWARKQRDHFEERMRNLRVRAAAEREEMRKREQEAAEYRAMVERMLAELYRKNPEWAERKENLQRPPKGDAKTRPSPVSS